MERERAFNFKLSIPHGIIPGQVSAVKRQDMTEDSRSFMQPLQALNKSFDKDSNMPFPATSKVAPSTRQDAGKKGSVMLMEKEETALRSCQLYSRLFEEAEKIKGWKAKMDVEVVQKDRKLQENKRTIENQRKAIQELQFGNESLSMKMEEEMRKNTDLRNKINSTQNLCHLLKETFERSSEKMHQYESEREETHLLFMQNSSNIQGTINAFEGLRVQADTDRHNFLKLKEELEQCDDAKEKIQAEFRIKHEQVVMLHVKMNEKENKLQEVLQNLQEARRNCSQLHEAAKRHQEMLEESKQEKEILSEKLLRAEQANKESEENREALESTLARKEEENTKALVEKSNRLEDLKKMSDDQAVKLQGVLVTAGELQVTLTSELQRVKELEEALGSVTEELKLKTSEIEKLQMEETKALQLAKDLEGKNDAEIHQLMENREALESTLARKEEEHTKALVEKSNRLEDLKKMSDDQAVKLQGVLVTAGELQVTLTSELQRVKELEEALGSVTEELKLKTSEIEKLQMEETKALQLAKDLEGKNAEIHQLMENEKRIIKEMERGEEEKQQLRDELEYLKATIEEQGQVTENLHKRQEESNKRLQNELTKKEKQLKAVEMKVQTSQLVADEAVKSKEEIEMKCQHKISDMVALMDKHKKQYGKVIEDKNGELDEIRKKEVEIKAEKTSLELELSELKTDIVNLKLKLENEVKEKKMKSLKEDIQQKARNTLTPVANSKGIRGRSSSNTSSKSRAAVFDFSNEQENDSSKTPSWSTAKKVMGTPLRKVSETGILKTSWSSGNRAALTPRIKSYRIRTPPSAGKSALLGRNTLVLDTKSDSSEQNDSLSFSLQSDAFKINLYPGDSGPLHQYGNLHKKSPAVMKSPGAALKIAAVKRMRDAGWTAVTNSDKRKKKTSEKIFA